MKKVKTGRPRAYPPLNKALYLQVNEQIHRDLKAVAALEGITMADLIRNIAQRVIEEKLPLTPAA